jgi:hypothetical protein
VVEFGTNAFLSILPLTGSSAASKRDHAMNDNTDKLDHDQTDEKTPTCEVSDEALEAAAGSIGGNGTGPNGTCGLLTGCC